MRPGQFRVDRRRCMVLPTRVIVAMRHPRVARRGWIRIHMLRLSDVGLCAPALQIQRGTAPHGRPARCGMILAKPVRSRHATPFRRGISPPGLKRLWQPSLLKNGVCRVAADNAARNNKGSSGHRGEPKFMTAFGRTDKITSRLAEQLNEILVEGCRHAARARRLGSAA